MKSRMSFFNKTVFQKNITRFAPLWALYFVGLLIILISSVNARSPGAAAADINDTIGYFGIANLIYAALCAQLLFGDLFQSRLCNALHAMPLERKHWFAGNIAAGLCFSAAPNLLGVLTVIPRLGNYWWSVFAWFLGVELHFLFFFGLAVLCIMLTGNRFAMVAVYGILNFLSVIVQWFVVTIYEPLLYGVNIDTAVFTQLCPVVNLCTSQEFLWEYDVGPSDAGFSGLGQDCIYLAVLGVLGVISGGVALVLYRRRHLECAGSFMAFPGIKPVFQVIYTLSVGVLFALISEVFGLSSSYLGFLLVGILVGWFTGRMLLQRRVKVFQGKSFAGLALLLVLLGGSIWLTFLDPLGVAVWTPDAGQVSAVEVNTGNRISTWNSDYLYLTDKENVQAVIDAHKELTALEPGSSRYRTVTLRYTLFGGRQVSRTYRMGENSMAWDTFSAMYQEPQRLLGYQDWEQYLDHAEVGVRDTDLKRLCSAYVKKQAEAEGIEDPQAVDAAIHALTGELTRTLLEAIRKDLEAGLLPQTLVADKSKAVEFVDIYVASEYGKGFMLNVYTNSENTVAWFRENAHILDPG